jgi:peptidoglycan hydrolase CwlO-like protein
LGDALVPAFERISRAVSDLSKFFSGLTDGQKSMIAGMVILVATVGPVLVGLGKITVAIQTLTLAMAKNPATAIAIGLLAIASAAYLAIKGVSALEAALLKQAGVSNLTGSEDEREKLNVLKEQIEAQKKLLEGRRDLSESYETRRDLQADIDVLKTEIGQIDQAIAKSNILAFETEQLALSAQEAQQRLDDLANGVVATTTAVKPAAGSIGELTEELKALQIQFDTTGDSMKRAQLGAQINQLTNEIEGMDAVAKANILPITAPMERASIAAQQLTTSVDGLNRGFIPLAKAPVTITELTTQMAMAQQFATQFTDSFGAGMANVLVQSQDVMKTLENIGKLLLSSAIQTGIKYLLMGSSGFGVSGGFGGLLGGLFKPQVASVPTQVMGAGMMSVSGSFKVQGTDLIAVINRSERQLR